jgi:TPR repeat protein
MPDSTMAPAIPIAWREARWRTSEQDAGLYDRSPSSTAARALPTPSATDAIARAEPVEAHQHDVQCVGFTSASGDEDHVASPVPSTAEPDWLEPIPLTVPELEGALRHFAKPPAPAEGYTATSGLANRFAWVLVARSSPDIFDIVVPQESPTDFAQFLSTPASGVVVVHRPGSMPVAGDNAPLSAVPYAARLEVSRSFPASINTPVTADDDRAFAAGAWRTALAPAAASVDAANGRISGAVLRRCQMADFPAEALWRAWDWAVPHVARVSRYVEVHKEGLRMSGLVAVSAMVVMGAYGGGALLAALTGTPATAGKTSSGYTTGRQVATADPAPRPPSPAAPSATEPPSDPAARAAFYMARAKTGDAVAQYDVGVLYARGEGLVQDYANAATWFRAAAAQGNAAAQYNLGVLYAGGLGVVANPSEALNWYRNAAEQNHLGAQFNLALAYAQGIGSKQDFSAAARWYRRAAEQGLVPAMVNLAILYEHGSGVDRSLVDAYAWYSAAGDRSESAAKQRADELHRSLGDKDKARAEALAATIGATLNAASPPAASSNAPPA